MAKNNDKPSDGSSSTVATGSTPPTPPPPNSGSTGSGDPFDTPIFNKTNEVLGRVANAEEEYGTYPAPALSQAYERGSPSVGPGTGELSQLAQDTIRQVLGWRYRSGDVNGFSAAINRAFTLKQDDDGVVDWTWTPQTYAIQADLGEITGAQASILEQAKVTINYVLPLLDGLKALRADSDEEDIKALSGIVRMKLSAILTELGRVGGPRVQRMDLLFEELLGCPIMHVATSSSTRQADWHPVHISDIDHWFNFLQKLDDQESKIAASSNRSNKKQQAYSLLRQLGKEFGVAPELANNIEEERDLTNFMIIVDSTLALRTAWIGKRKYFNRFGHSQAFLGTQLVWLSRQIEVVAETVRAAYATMDSVYFGPQERQATDIFFESLAEDGNAIPGKPLKEAAITVGDLLDWVETFATQEGPQLLQEAGKDGVLSFRATVKRLEEWVEAARIYSEGGPDPAKHAPRSFFTIRVARALREIENQLDATLARTRGITRSTRFGESDFVEIANLPKPPTAQVRDIGHLNGNSSLNAQ